MSNIMQYNNLMRKARFEENNLKCEKKEKKRICKLHKKEERAERKRKQNMEIKQARALAPRKIAKIQLELDKKKKSQKHPLLVLSKERAAEIKEYAYILSGRQCCNNFTSWDSCEKPKLTAESPLPIYILTKKDEFEEDEQVELKRGCGERIRRDEYVLLGLAFESLEFSNGKAFDTEKEFSEMEKNIRSQVQARKKKGAKGSLNHFGSSARGVFSFGKTAKYTLEPGTQSSVSDFSFKAEITEDVRVAAKNKALLYLQETVKYLAKEIKGYTANDAVKLTNTSLKELNKRAVHTCLENFLENDLQGYAAGHFNFAYNCEKAHSERDSTYTLLHMPKQICKDSMLDDTQFEWFTTGKGGDPIRIPMKEGAVIFFSAYGLSHRQQHEKGSLMNLSFYGNKTLFQKGTKSAERAMRAKIQSVK